MEILFVFFGAIILIIGVFIDDYVRKK